MRKHPNAFTLIELTIALLIIGISAAIVFPKLTGCLVQRAKIRSSVNRITALAEYAYQQAACTRRTHVLYLDTEKGAYWVAIQPSDEQTIPTPENSILKGSLPEEVEMANVSLGGEHAGLQSVVAIRFSPQGWADPATIDLICSTGEIMRIVIDELSAQIENYDMEAIH